MAGRIPCQIGITAVLAAMCQAICLGQPAAQANSNGFLVKHEVVIDAPRTKVYDALVDQVSQWWDPRHTFSGDSSNLSIDPRPGGCFCEVLSNGGGVEHLRVVFVGPEELLRMSGGLGPLQALGIAGSFTWSLADTGGRTTVEVTYAVGGFMEGGLDHIAPAVDAVIGEQVQRFKRFAETGNPSPETGR